MKNQHVSLQDGSQNEPKPPQVASKRQHFSCSICTSILHRFLVRFGSQNGTKIDQKINKKSPCETRLPQDRSMTAQVRPKTAPRPPKRLPGGPQSLPRRRKRPQEPPKMHLRSTKSIPKGFPDQAFQLLIS